MSIRLRLALWYGSLTGVVLALVSLTTYAIHTRAHYDDLDRVMVTATQHIADEYLASPDPQRNSGLLTDPIAPDLVTRIYAADGRQLLPAPPSSDTAPALDAGKLAGAVDARSYDWIARLAPAIVHVPHDHGSFTIVRDAEGHRWRVHLLPLEDGALLAALAPLERIDLSVDRFRELVTLLSAVGVALTLGAGLLLAHRALRPVAVMTDTAAEIAHSREHGRRVPTSERARGDELNRLATTFNEMLASLDEVYQAQQRFVSDASHELRAPLTIIQANLDFIERHPDAAPAERHAALAEAGSEARRLASLVADLLALARADAGLELRGTAVELDRLVLDALAESRHLARGQRLEVTSIEPAVIVGDADRLKQLVLILLDNALKYTPSSGSVRVALARQAGSAELTIADTGVGIPPYDLERVFERFYRADPARSRDPGGTGLGLPIARWIAHLHGGEVTLRSELERGTTVVVQLPLMPATGSVATES